ncbi:MAG: hypothetical protein BSR46_10670 [Candidatus Dactylopiibacterium carminicum]|nr:MAG: hypothetical protein BSR46_10670 [Candidatus Dactylopiibacterium carminicum]
MQMDEQSWQTRDYRAEDAPALAALSRAAILGLGPQAYPAEQCAAWAAVLVDDEAWTQRLQEAWVRVAHDDDGNIVGFGAIALPGQIDLLFTEPDRSRQGVASLILDDLLAIAAAMGARSLTVKVSALSRGLFERHDFVADGPPAERPGLPAGQPMRRAKV